MRRYVSQLQATLIKLWPISPEKMRVQRGRELILQAVHIDEMRSARLTIWMWFLTSAEGECYGQIFES